MAQPREHHPPTIGEMHPAGLRDFGRDLATWRDQRVIAEEMAHGVDPTAPAGLVPLASAIGLPRLLGGRDLPMGRRLRRARPLGMSLNGGVESDTDDHDVVDDHVAPLRRPVHLSPSPRPAALRVVETLAPASPLRAEITDPVRVSPASLPLASLPRRLAGSGAAVPAPRAEVYGPAPLPPGAVGVVDAPTPTTATSTVNRPFDQTPSRSGASATGSTRAAWAMPDGHAELAPSPSASAPITSRRRVMANVVDETRTGAVSGLPIAPGRFRNVGPMVPDSGFGPESFGAPPTFSESVHRREDPTFARQTSDDAAPQGTPRLRTLGTTTTSDRRSTNGGPTVVRSESGVTPSATPSTRSVSGPQNAATGAPAWGPNDAVPDFDSLSSLGIMPALADLSSVGGSVPSSLTGAHPPAVDPATPRRQEALTSAPRSGGPLLSRSLPESAGTQDSSTTIGPPQRAERPAPVVAPSGPATSPASTPPPARAGVAASAPAPLRRATSTSAEPSLGPSIGSSTRPAAGPMSPGLRSSTTDGDEAPGAAAAPAPDTTATLPVASIRSRGGRSSFIDTAVGEPVGLASVASDVGADHRAGALPAPTGSPSGASARSASEPGVPSGGASAMPARTAVTPRPPSPPLGRLVRTGPVEGSSAPSSGTAPVIQRSAVAAATSPTDSAGPALPHLALAPSPSTRPVTSPSRVSPASERGPARSTAIDEPTTPSNVERTLPTVDRPGPRTHRVEDERAVWSAAPHRTLPIATAPPTSTAPTMAPSPARAPLPATATTRRGIAEPTQAELDGWSRLAVVQRRSTSPVPVAPLPDTPSAEAMSSNPAPNRSSSSPTVSTPTIGRTPVQSLVPTPRTAPPAAPSSSAEASPIRNDLFDCCGEKAPAAKQANAERTPEPELDIDTQARLLWPRLRAMMLHELRIDRERSGTLRDTYR